MKSSELRRLWRLPVWGMVLFLGKPRDEGQRLYCPACRKVLNRCVVFLALMGLFGLVLLCSELFFGR
jgi:hypothetical protein